MTADQNVTTRDDGATYSELLTAAQAELRAALVLSEAGDRTASMRAVLSDRGTGCRSQAVTWLVEGGARFGLDPGPDLWAEAAKHVLWIVLNPRHTDESLTGWWESQLRGLVHRADMALATLAGKDWS